MAALGTAGAPPVPPPGGSNKGGLTGKLSKDHHLRAGGSFDCQKASSSKGTTFGGASLSPCDPFFANTFTAPTRDNLQSFSLNAMGGGGGGGPGGSSKGAPPAAPSPGMTSML